MNGFDTTRDKDRCIDVYLHGPLATRFGEHHRLAVRTPTEAIAAFDANFPGFVAAFAEHGHYYIFADGDWRDGDEAAIMPASREIHFCPQIEGRAFLGALLVGALFPAIAGTTTATIIGGLLFAGLMIGISFLLTPKPEKPKEDKRDENYAFTGPENVTGQGAAVPLIYGRVYAGSVVVSAGLELGSDLSAAPPPVPPPTPATPNTSPAPGVPPPDGGYPAMTTDRYGTHPSGGWVRAGTTTVASRDGGTLKYVDVWQGTGTNDEYFWNYVRGYYYENDQPRDDDYQRGGHR